MERIKGVYGFTAASYNVNGFVYLKTFQPWVNRASDNRYSVQKPFWLQAVVITRR